MQKKRDNPSVKASGFSDNLKEGNSSDSASSNSQDLLRSILQHMKEKEGLDLQNLISIFNEIGLPQDVVPLSIFSKKLSPSESICKFLKENRELTYHEIGVLLNRNDRSIWTSYNRATKKSEERFIIDHTKETILLPLSIFKDRSKSILEQVVFYLHRNYNMSGYKVASLLNKNPSSIATVLNRAKTKHEVSEAE